MAMQQQACFGHRLGAWHHLGFRHLEFVALAGEYIAAEKLENAFQDCSLVEQVWVYGNSYENFLVGVAVPDKGELTKWAKSNGLSSDLKQLSNEPKVFPQSICNMPWRVGNIQSVYL